MVGSEFDLSCERNKGPSKAGIEPADVASGISVSAYERKIKLAIRKVCSYYKRCPLLREEKHSTS